MQRYQNVTVGCDPEFFLKTANDSFVGAYHYLKGTKWRPEALDQEGSAILHDNVMVEFNTIPAVNREEFITHVDKVLHHLRLKIPSDIEFSFLPSAHFKLNSLRSAEAKVFGCEPDFNAWEGARKNPTIHHPDRTLRTSGGHIHVGFDDPTNSDRFALMMHMDVFLGIPSLLLDAHGAERRQMYGKAGAFRPKPYGAEYRVLSNFWLQSQELKGWAFDATMETVNRLNDGFQLDDEDIEKIVPTINNGDLATAHKLITKYNLPMV